MDALDRIAPVAAPLLATTDTLLASHGAPAEHRIWGLLRRMRVTPADAVAAMTALDVTAARSAEAMLRDQADAYSSAALPPEVGWIGPAGDEYHARVSAAARQLHTDLAGQLGVTAACLADVASWAESARRTMAGTLARVLGSAEAIAVRTGDRDGVLAAAEIGAHILGTVDQIVSAGQAIHELWRDRLDELPLPPAPATGPYRPDATVSVRP